MSILNKILKSSGNVLYYPGCLTKFVAKDIFNNYKKLLEMCGEDFIVLGNREVCCGSPVLNAGFPDDFKNLAEKNLKVFKEYNITTIITGCPTCYDILNNKYREVLGDVWHIKVEHMTTYLLRKLREGKLKLPKLEISATYHDPCHLGRYSYIYEEPRSLLKELGVNLREMVLSYENSFCCGAGGGVQSNNKELAEKIASERVDQAVATGAQYLVTPCPMCTYNLRNGSNQKIKVIELTELLLNQLDKRN